MTQVKPRAPRPAGRWTAAQPVARAVLPPTTTDTGGSRAGSEIARHDQFSGKPRGPLDFANFRQITDNGADMKERNQKGAITK